MFLHRKAKRADKAPSKGLDFKTMIRNVQQAREEQGGFKRITPDMLQQQATRLKKIDHVSVPGWQGVQLSRDRASGAYSSGAHFADFIQQTRRDLSHLASTATGQDIAQRIGDSGHSVFIRDRGDNPDRGGSNRPHDRTAASQLGVGSDATVTHQPDRSKLASRQDRVGYVGSSSAMSLGHELIHAVHTVEGSHRGSAIHPESGAKQEERDTVGHHDGSGALTENKLRQELQTQHYGSDSGVLKPIRPRKHYGGRDLKF
ncbi:hypothetical protein GCM10011297_13500 [Bacterioplanes sanyensis]|uniref:M91 family zinc metallopeptidase n=1 Tax=Bacterioplanes sanyensis TaxID=1249553 RepID=UPI001676DA8F|nr:M91 family zinc metallopeptidase [Bacterioplanes sanyensis]GGY41795.1 hypothetical protein GCM10011297_13500 [Bacterioplanes sanyensis]